MATDKTDITQTGEATAAPTPTNTKSSTKTKAQKTAKAEAPALKAVGREACKQHKLAQVWVTDDGQCFPMMSDAKAHAANLKNNELIKVTAE